MSVRPLASNLLKPKNFATLFLFPLRRAGHARTVRAGLSAERCQRAKRARRAVPTCRRSLEVGIQTQQPNPATPEAR
jgi:hypothetical protein